MNDLLTALPTRHQLHLDLPELAACASAAHPLSLLLLEVRDFDLWQERLTPLAADRLIQLTARAIVEGGPQGCYAARWDNSCFALLLPDTPAWQAEEVGEQLRDRLSKSDLPPAFEAQQLRPDLNCGAASVTPVDPNVLFREARRQLERGRGSLFTRLLREQKPALERAADQEAAAACVRLAEGWLAHGDPYLRRHGELTAGFSRQVGEALGLGADMLDELTQAAVFADVAMVEAAGACLHKPGSLTLSEYRRVQRHVGFATELVRELGLPAGVLRTVECHHEKSDGSGYPQGLTQPEIPLSAAILGACGAYAALLLPRPYRPARRPGRAKAELSETAGTLWPKDVVRAVVLEL